MFVIANALNSIDELVNEFGWIPVFLRNPSWKQDHYIRQLTDAILDHGTNLKSYVINALKALDRLPSDRQESAKDHLGLLQVTSAEQLLVATFRLVMDTRNESEYLIGLASHAMKPVIIEVINRLDISEEIFHILYIDEVVGLLDHSLQSADIPLDDRLEICGYWFKNDREFTQMGNADAQDFLNQQRSHQATDTPSNTKPAQGICASIGTAEGIARVVKGTEDFTRFENGNILVAESTTADYVPIMRRAAGVITEHGGVTCHAAIVARELGIPAIVSYPSATRVLPDGTRVTFNAINGTVTVLS